MRKSRLFFYIPLALFSLLIFCQLHKVLAASPPPLPPQDPSPTVTRTITPTVPAGVYLNSGTAQNCTSICSSHNLVCSSVGINTSGNDGSRGAWSTDHCGTYPNTTCNTVMINNRTHICIGRSADWTYCKCVQPSATPTPTITTIPTVTPLPKVTLSPDKQYTARIESTKNIVVDYNFSNIGYNGGKCNASYSGFSADKQSGKILYVPRVLKNAFTSTTWRSGFAVQNTENAATSVTMNLYRTDSGHNGQLAKTTSFNLGPYGSYATSLLDARFADLANGVYAGQFISSSTKIVADVNHANKPPDPATYNMGTGSEAVARERAGQLYKIPFFYKSYRPYASVGIGDTWESGISVQNIGIGVTRPSATNLTLTIYKTDGTLAKAACNLGSLAYNGSLTIWDPEGTSCFQGLTPGVYSAVLNSSAANIVVEVSHAARGNPPAVDGKNFSYFPRKARSTAVTQYVNRVYNKFYSYITNIIIRNDSETSTNHIVIDYYDQNGNKQTSNTACTIVDLQKGAIKGINVNTLGCVAQGNDNGGPIFSAVVRPASGSTTPFSVVYFIHNEVGARSGLHMGYVANADEDKSQTFYVTRVLSNFRGFNTGITVNNVESTAGVLTLTVLDQGTGVPVMRKSGVPIKSHSSLSFYVPSYFVPGVEPTPTTIPLPTLIPGCSCATTKKCSSTCKDWRGVTLSNFACETSANCQNNYARSKGDATGDNKICGVDYIEVQNSFSGLYRSNREKFLRSDFNGDSEVGSLDMRIFQTNFDTTKCETF